MGVFVLVLLLLELWLAMSVRIREIAYEYGMIGQMKVLDLCITHTYTCSIHSNSDESSSMPCHTFTSSNIGAFLHAMDMLCYATQPIFCVLVKSVECHKSPDNSKTHYQLNSPFESVALFNFIFLFSANFAIQSNFKHFRMLRLNQSGGMKIQLIAFVEFSSSLFLTIMYAFIPIQLVDIVRSINSKTDSLTYDMENTSTIDWCQLHKSNIMDDKAYMLLLYGAVETKPTACRYRISFWTPIECVWNTHKLAHTSNCTVT